MIKILGQEIDIDLDDAQVLEDALSTFKEAERQADEKLAELKEDAETAAGFPTFTFGLYRDCLVKVIGEENTNRLLGTKKSLRDVSQACNDLMDFVYEQFHAVNAMNESRMKSRAAKYGVSKIAKR